jgi:D-glycero-D-manno-heptose 1,7-bisphosphate phosphatase
MMKRAIFLDRDGVVVKDVGCLRSSDQIEILDNVPVALKILKDAGFALFVVSNQTAISRGWATVQQVIKLNEEIFSIICKAGGPQLDGFYFCPHHPNATLEEYRVDCNCRKPRAGLILKAAEENNIDLNGSFMVGDRITDIIAGSIAGCKTILVETGAHLENPIETSEPINTDIKPYHTCSHLSAAAEWVLEVM